jgi:hypothetical protein
LDRSASSGRAASADIPFQGNRLNRVPHCGAVFIFRRQWAVPETRKPHPLLVGAVRSAKITHGRSGIHPEIAPAGTQNLIRPVGKYPPPQENN